MKRRQRFFVGEVVRITNRGNTALRGVITSFRKGFYAIEHHWGSGNMATVSKQQYLRRMLVTFGGPMEIERR